MDGFKVMINRFVLMIQFFTRIPVPVNVEAEPEDFGKGLVFAPLVGLLIGAILLIVFLIGRLVFPSFICSLLVTAVYASITGGLHFDGLGDTFDGVFSNRSRERIFEIMKDSRVGTNAVLVLIFAVLTDIFCLSYIISYYNEIYLPVFCILFMPAAGRIGSVISAGLHRYARSDNGLGKCFVDNCSKKEVFVCIIIYFIILLLTCVFSGVYKNTLLLLAGVVSAFSAVLCAVLISSYFARKLGGVTGDVLGAVCEINQLVFLIVLVALI